ncbi:Outer membrane protein assembly factor BamB [Carboxydocella thermautotrophica]|nr:Outer membrane protein assembly factor BamB [Carboxydocella thermautotrophica]
MRKLIFLLSLVLAWCWPGLARASETVAAAVYQGYLDPAADLTFAVITDSHVGFSTGLARTRLAVTELNQNPVALDFVIHMGDMTEKGLAWEINAYRQAVSPLKVPLYNALGNHDSRWSDQTKPVWARLFGQGGKSYYSFDYKGYHFIILDSAIPGATHGHIDGPQLSWLQADLARLAPGTPVLVFSHHPLAFSNRFIDNEDQVLEILQGYNVLAYFAGHGHSHLQWNRNGRPFFMVKAIVDGGYALVQIKEGKLTLWHKQIGFPWLKKLAEVSARETVNLQGAEVQAAATGISLRLSGEERPERIEARVDRSGNWQKLAPRPDGSWQLNWQITTPGQHLATVRLVFSGGQVYHLNQTFQVTGQPALLWQAEVKGSVQSAPLPWNKQLLVTSSDGQLTALDRFTGNRLWSYQVSPEGEALVGGAVLFPEGAMAVAVDGWAAAVNDEGQVLWQVKLPAGSLATPIWSGKYLICALATGQVVALAPENGGIVWNYKTGGGLRAQPVLAGNRLFVGSNDGYVYALAADSGKLLWKTLINSGFYYAPATAPMAVGYGLVYAVAPADKRQGGYSLFALDQLDGKLAWKAKLAGGYGAPLVQGQAVFVNAVSGRLYAYHPLTGKELWQFNSGKTIYDTRPVLVGGQLVWNTFYGGLIGIDAQNGRLSWQYKTGDAFMLAAPAAMGDVVYGADLEGQVLALKVPLTPTGAILQGKLPDWRIYLAEQERLKAEAQKKLAEQAKKKKKAKAKRKKKK